MLHPDLANHDGQPSLRSFLSSLPDEQIFRVAEPIDIDFTPTALVMALEARAKTPVVWMDQVKGFDHTVVCNLFASRERIAKAVGTTPTQFHSTWIDALRKPERPRIVTDGPVQEMVYMGDSVDVTRLPISRHFQDDAGRYIGSGILVCRDPDTGVGNLSYQRLQLKSQNRFGASLHSRGHAWEHLRRCRELGRNLEVAIVIGVHPAINLAASAKVAKEIDEYDLVSSLLQQPLDVVPCKTVDLYVPAQAEIVLEGELLADVHEPEGPYGEYTGYSTSRSTNDVLVIHAVTHRQTPIFHDIIPGYSSEHLLLSRSPREAFVFMRLKEIMPNIVAINYPKTGTHFHAYLAIKKTAEGQPNQALALLMGLDPYVKFAVVVDADVDPFNEQEVLWALATRFQADTDLFVIPRMLCNRLDPSSRDGTSAKLGLDATAPLDWSMSRTSIPQDALVAAQKLLASFIH
jgi:2,5-furandicarboxylate decarboxylase 1